jgi:hypothetical protein
MLPKTARRTRHSAVEEAVGRFGENIDLDYCSSYSYGLWRVLPEFLEPPLILVGPPSNVGYVRKDRLPFLQGAYPDFEPDHLITTSMILAF